ncbi:MAG: YigZ family protein [Flavobacteriales bacterium]|nr:YigZ family protein [Flavobacteriales bacterium]
MCLKLGNKESYLTLNNSSTGEYKEKGSKFLAYAFPVLSENSFKEQLSIIKTEHPNGRHFCYAFRFGINGEQYRYNDDGEPKNSAGSPIYGQLLSKELTNIAIVVVRYFGGTKLGVSGLVNAYKTAAKEALENGEIITKKLTETYKIEFNYDKMSSIMAFINQHQLTVTKQHFELTCFVEIELEKANAADIIERLSEIQDINIKKAPNY